MNSWRMERLFGIVGVALLLFYLVARVQALVIPTIDLWDFQEALASPSIDGAKTKPNPPKVDFALWSEKRIREYETALGMKRDRPLAVLTISRIGVQVPVFEGTGDLTLNRGAGRIPGSAKLGSSGNVGIAAHRDGFFRGLKDIREGDHIELTLPGASLVYIVDSIKIVDPSDVSVLQARLRPSLTLVTCYPFYFIGSAPKRYIVQATLDGAEKTSVSGVNSSDQKDDKENKP
jgi:sortase A